MFPKKRIVAVLKKVNCLWLNRTSTHPVLCFHTPSPPPPPLALKWVSITAPWVKLFVKWHNWRTFSPFVSPLFVFCATIQSVKACTHAALLHVATVHTCSPGAFELYGGKGWVLRMSTAGKRQAWKGDFATECRMRRAVVNFSAHLKELYMRKILPNEPALGSLFTFQGAQPLLVKSFWPCKSRQQLPDTN